jgi:hypothetical protein
MEISDRNESEDVLVKIKSLPPGTFRSMYVKHVKSNLLARHAWMGTRPQVEATAHDWHFDVAHIVSTRISRSEASGNVHSRSHPMTYILASSVYPNKLLREGKLLL